MGLILKQLHSKQQQLKAMAQSYSSIQWWQATLKAPSTSNDKARNQSDGKKKEKKKNHAQKQQKFQKNKEERISKSMQNTRKLKQMKKEVKIMRSLLSLGRQWVCKTTIASPSGATRKYLETLSLAFKKLKKFIKLT